MSNPNSNDGLGTLHKSSAHLVSKSKANCVDHSKDIGHVVNDDSLSIKRIDNEANDTTVDTIVYDNTPAAAVSPTDNSIKLQQVSTQVATHDNLSDDNGTKASLEKSAVQEVVTQQKLHGSNNNDPFHSHSLEFDKLQFLEKQPKDNATEMEKNGLSIDYSKRVTFQGDIIDRISAVSKIITKKSIKEDNGLICEKCQNKFNPCLDIKNTPTKDDTRKKSRSKSSKGGIAKFTSDYWQHGLQTSVTYIPTTPTRNNLNEDNGLTCPHCAKGFASQGGLDYHVEKKVCQNKFTNSTSRKRKLPKGVHETTAGNYQVQMFYQGRNRSIRNFQTLESATLASEIVRSMFEKDKELHLSAKECERNIKLAKEAAWNVKDGKQSGNDTRKKRRSQSRSSSAIFPSSTINYLNECSRLNPYPDADQTARICIVTGLNNIQVEEWMSSARKKRLSVEAKTHINKWIEEHSINPYPTREVKDAWIKLYGIENDSQLDGYLHRARKNIKENSTMKNDVSSLKTCGLCNIQKKEWSYTIGEWNKLDDRDRLCKYCISKVRTASLSKDDGLVAVTRTRTGPVVKSRERLVAIPQDTSLKRGKGQTVKRDRKRPRKKKELSQKEKYYCSSSSGRGRPKKSKKSIQAEAYLAKGYQLCSVAGCIKRVQQGGVCCRHGAKTTRALCSYKGTDEGFNGFSMGVGTGGQCTNVAKRGGLCRRHGAFDLPDCSDPFCKRVAQKGDDYCVLHIKSICLPQKEGNRKRTVVYDGTERQKKKPKLKPFEPSKVVASKSKRAAPSRRQSSAEGVYELPSGSWRVMVYYQGSHRGIGTFQTLEQATLASEVARSMIKKDKGQQLSAEDCERNFKLAKEAAVNTAMPDQKASKIQRRKLPTGVYETLADNDNTDETLKKNIIIRSQGLPEEAKININKWIEEHSINPFPTREEKDKWIKKDYVLDGYLHRARKDIKENPAMMTTVTLSLKTCSLCNIQKKEWSYSRDEWNKLDDRDRQCKYCISKVRTASLSKDDGLVAVTRTRKITSTRGTASSGGSRSQTISRKDMINEIQGVRRLTGSKNRWGAVLKVSGNDIFLGSYTSPTEAAHAVEMAKEESKMRSSVTSLHDMPSDKLSESLMDTETAKDEDLSARISKYLSPKYQSEKQAEELHKEQVVDEPADNLIAAGVMTMPTIESIISKFEEARKAGYQPKTFDLQAYMAEHDKKYTYLVDVKNDDTNISNKRRKKSTPKRLIGGL